MNNSLAPILLFVYNRPRHTLQTLEALQKNALAGESRLYIFADGPKHNASAEEHEQIQEVRRVIRQQNWCGEVVITERANNMGIEASELSAIGEKITIYGKVIVLEDDLVTGTEFLTYMNKALQLYENVGHVYGVSGYMFPIQTKQQELALLPFTSVWGWGTWKNRWDVYENDIAEKDTILQNRWLTQRFNIGDSDHTALFNHPHNPWDIRWYYSVFVRNGLFLFPSQTLVTNIGMDGSGTHYTGNSNAPLQTVHHIAPEIVLLSKINFKIYSLVTQYFYKEKPSVLQRIKNYAVRLRNNYMAK